MCLNDSFDSRSTPICPFITLRGAAAAVRKRGSERRPDSPSGRPTRNKHARHSVLKSILYCRWVECKLKKIIIIHLTVSVSLNLHKRSLCQKNITRSHTSSLNSTSAGLSQTWSPLNHRQGKALEVSGTSRSKFGNRGLPGCCVVPSGSHYCTVFL